MAKCFRLQVEFYFMYRKRNADRFLWGWGWDPSLISTFLPHLHPIDNDVFVLLLLQSELTLV